MTFWPAVFLHETRTKLCSAWPAGLFWADALRAQEACFVWEVSTAINKPVPHLSISQNGRWPARARPTAHILFFPSPNIKGLAAKSTGPAGCRPQPGVICTLFPKKNQPARLPFFFSGCCCRECSRSDVIQFLNMCYVKIYQVWPDLYKKILMFIILNKYY